MAFGTEGESQRLPIDAAAVEAPSAVVPPVRPLPGASAKPAVGPAAFLDSSHAATVFPRLPAEPTPVLATCTIHSTWGRLT